MNSLIVAIRGSVGGNMKEGTITREVSRNAEVDAGEKKGRLMNH